MSQTLPHHVLPGELESLAGGLDQLAAVARGGTALGGGSNQEYLLARGAALAREAAAVIRRDHPPPPPPAPEPEGEEAKTAPPAPAPAPARQPTTPGPATDSVKKK